MFFVEAPRYPPGDRSKLAAMDPRRCPRRLGEPQDQRPSVPVYQTAARGRLDVALLAAVKEQLDFMRSRHEHRVLDDDLPPPLVETDPSPMPDRIRELRVTVVAPLEDVAII